MARPESRDSTIVRARRIGLGTFFRAGEWVAPGLSAQVALRLWFTVPPGPAPTPLPTGGTPFAVATAGIAIRGHVWGDGPVVYFVHGWGGRGSQFADYVQPLVAGGFRVVLFDGPSHGGSDPGRHGPRQTHGLELGQALDAVFARFGPAHAIVAHSLGTIATYLALRYGWISTTRLVLLAPLVEEKSLFDRFQHALGFGRRTRRAFDRAVNRFIGMAVADFDARRQAVHVEPIPTLVLHDRGDRQAPYEGAVGLVNTLPAARLVSSDGLGHRLILRDAGVLGEVLGFLCAERPPAKAASVDAR